MLQSAWLVLHGALQHGGILRGGALKRGEAIPGKTSSVPAETQGSRSSSREVRIRVLVFYYFFSLVDFSRETLAQTRVKGHYWGT